MILNWRTNTANRRQRVVALAAGTLVSCGIWMAIFSAFVVGQEPAKSASADAAQPAAAEANKNVSKAPQDTPPAAESAPTAASAAPSTPTKDPITSPVPAASTDSTAKESSVDAASQRVVPFEYSPYRIRIWVAAEPSPYLDDQLLADLRVRIAQLADVRVGAPWSVTVAEPPTELRETVAICPQLLSTTAITNFQKDVFKDDKLILVSLAATPRDLRVWTRELDCHTRTWGAVITRTLRQPAALADSVFDSIVAGFDPLARIEDGQGKTCTVRGRATGLITTADSPAQIAKGDVLQPIFRQNDRYGNPMSGRIEALPFTFLHVTSTDPESSYLLNCNVHSGMRSPIHGRSVSTSRRERWAIKVRPRFTATEIYVESRPVRRTDPKIPLPGIEVFAKAPDAEAPKELSEEEKKVADKKNPAVLLGVTDWRGSFSVAPDQSLLQIVYLKNGGLLLARLPIVPGLEKRLVAEIPDDNPRLQAEGFMKGLNSEVTDLVVQRQLIAVRMRRKIKENKLDEAEKLYEEFRGLKTLNDLQQMINVLQKRQRGSNSSVVKQKVEKLYSDERELLAKHIDAELQVKLFAELTQARANPPRPEAETPVPNVLQPDKSETEKKDKLPAALQPKGGENPAK